MRLATYPTLSQVLLPQTQVWHNVVSVLGASWLVALLAQISIPLQPVPITGQTFGVLLAGAALGARRGALALLAYLAQGLIGLPFFAGGTSGMARLLGPTGGYLVGFVAAAALVGWLSERGWDRRFISTFAAMALGNLVIYALGAPWLAQFVGWERALSAGVLPFLPGDAIKALLAALALPSAWALINRTGHPRL
ncbi:MAG: biotin transporter BioY [Anaerolineae bacterium]|nr:biotin transporter BioY [Thermoflexales bacterium]MDW8293323.1 biotin transporter BioY [Anaerolineae bacterium]